MTDHHCQSPFVPGARVDDALSRVCEATARTLADPQVKALLQRYADAMRGFWAAAHERRRRRVRAIQRKVARLTPDAFTDAMLDQIEAALAGVEQGR